MKVVRFPAEMDSVLAEARVNPDAVFVPRYFIHKTIQAVMKHTTVRGDGRSSPVLILTDPTEPIYYKSVKSV